MRFALSFLLSALSSLVSASPIDAFAGRGLQRILREPTPKQTDASRRLDHHSAAHLDAAPNSVGLLLISTGAQEIAHVWLPLGKRVETRDTPTLPPPPFVCARDDADPQLARARDAGAVERDRMHGAFARQRYEAGGEAVGGKVREEEEPEEGGSGECDVWSAGRVGQVGGRRVQVLARRCGG
ncbi:hypothetical protein Q7P37_007249 [Cladosporium fusiforme]